MTPAIRATCRAFFGVYRAGRQVTPNRCGATPVRTFEELEAGRVRFVDAATAILEGA